MSEFAKYEEMRSRGALARDVYLTAKQDGVDAIKMIRLLRQVFRLSLAESKQVTDAPSAWSAKQKVTAGATVYWEGESAEEGFHLMQARVKDIVDGSATLEGHRKFRISDDGLEEVPVAGPRFASVPLSFFDQPLTARAEILLDFVHQAAHRGTERESGRKTV